MVQRLLLAGMLSGLIVAMFGFSYARIYAEPNIERAIALEEALAHDHKGAEQGTVSRDAQRNPGLLIGLAAYSAALGGFLAIGLAALHGRVDTRPRLTVWVLALAGYFALVLVPQIKYPASPPGVGSAATIGVRTELYFIMVAASVMCMMASAWLTYRARRRVRPTAAVLVGVGLFAVLASLVMMVMPSISEARYGFPRGLMFDFRVHAALLQVILWGGLGLLFGQLAERVVGHDRDQVPARREIPNA